MRPEQQQNKETYLRISNYSKIFRKFCRKSKIKPKTLYWVPIVQAIEFDAQGTLTRKVIKEDEQIIIPQCNKKTEFREA